MKLDSTDLKRRMILRRSSPKAIQVEEVINGRCHGRDMSSRNNQQYSNQLKKDVECYYCHKKEHIKAYCYKKQRKKKAKWNAIIVTSSGMCKPTVTRRKERKGMQVLSKRRAIMHGYLWSKPLKKNM
jgi:hypothetical protein